MDISIYLRHYIGHEFYCSILGEMTQLENVDANGNMWFENLSDTVRPDGRIYVGGEIMIWPDKDKTSWKDWITQHHKEYHVGDRVIVDGQNVGFLIKESNCSYFVATESGMLGFNKSQFDYSFIQTPKTADKLNMDIAAQEFTFYHNLILSIIHNGYGGIVSYKRWCNDKSLFLYVPVPFTEECRRITQAYEYNPISFQSEELFKEFISHPQNKKLLEKYYKLK